MTQAYLTTRPGKGGSFRYFWQPSSKLQAASPFRTERLADDPKIAIAQAQIKNDELAAWRAGEAQPVTKKPETIGQLVSSYKSSHHYRGKSAATKRTYGYAFRIIERQLGDKPLRSITPRALQVFYLQLRKYPAKAATAARVMRLLMEFARLSDLIAVNPAIRPGLVYTAPKGLLWSRDDVESFVRTADQLGYFEIGTAVFLNEWLGQRKGDILTLRQDAYRDGRLHKRQNKTGADVVLPVDVVAKLKARLHAQLNRNRLDNPGSAYLLPGKRGKAMTEQYFDAAFNEIRESAKLGQLIFKDLRHTAVTRLSEADCTPQQIAAITGHSLKTCMSIIDRYNILTTALAESAFRKRADAENQ
jgi:integrase